MPVTYRVISIGTLPSHPLWNEPPDVRTGHATTTLVSSGDHHILVDPSLPPRALEARLAERSPVRVGQIDQVFLTSADPSRRRTLSLFPEATWLLHEPEREAAVATAQARREEAVESGDEELLEYATAELGLLESTNVAPDSLTQGVDLFPLPGVTPGTCGLLLAQPAQTVLLCGDAVATVEHLERGQVLAGCSNIEQAQESFREAVEIADVIVPGRDNIVLNPVRRMM